MKNFLGRVMASLLLNSTVVTPVQAVKWGAISDIGSKITSFSTISRAPIKNVPVKFSHKTMCVPFHDTKQFERSFSDKKKEDFVKMKSLFWEKGDALYSSRFTVMGGKRVPESDISFSELDASIRNDTEDFLKTLPCLWQVEEKYAQIKSIQHFDEYKDFFLKALEMYRNKRVLRSFERLKKIILKYALKQLPTIWEEHSQELEFDYAPGKNISYEAKKALLGALEFDYQTSFLMHEPGTEDAFKECYKILIELYEFPVMSKVLNEYYDRCYKYYSFAEKYTQDRWLLRSSYALRFVPKATNCDPSSIGF